MPLCAILPRLATLAPDTLVTLRRAVHLSQRETAARLHMSVKHYQRWETGSRLIPYPAAVMFLSVIAEERQRYDALVAEAAALQQDLLPLVS